MLLLAGTSIYLGASVNPAFYWGCLAVIPLQWALSVHRRKRAAKARQLQIRTQWLSRCDPEEDFEWLEVEHEHLCDAAEVDCRVDGQTWNDLEMDRVFSRIDRTWTSLGEVSLYAFLRTPVSHLEQIRERIRLVDVLQSDAELREAVQKRLARLGKTRRFRLNDLEDNRLSANTFIRNACRVLAGLSALSLALVALFPVKEALLAVIVLFSLNMIVAAWFRWLVYWQANAFLYLTAAISCGKSLGGIEHESLRLYVEELTELSNKTRAICRKSRLFEQERNASAELPALMLGYARALFLLDVSDYFRLAELVQTHKTSIRRLLKMIGDLDAFQAIASYRKRFPVYCEPVLVDDGLVLECEDCRHPLLDDAVPNSISLRATNAFVTGSNASGKSTFLRTIALNALLAQSIGTVPAASYRACCFRILTSISIFDDLSESKSLYRAEAERMLEIIQATEGPHPILCSMDEPFKGTNSPERIGATIATLNHLGGKNILLLVASHHVQIALELGPRYDVFHFPVSVDGERSESNYLLHRGLDYEFNAIETLAEIGFPPAIVSSAKAETARVLGREAAEK
ncbi:MAG: hypothetical protein WC655_01935 [Candidatus Hydrogenedentales bacterium]